jgi:hypothetical protein
MATKRTIPDNYANTQYEDLDVTNGSASVSTADGTSGTLYAVYLDNTAGSGDAHFRVFDSAGAQNGSTDPDHIFYAPGNTARMYSIPAGLAYSTGLQYAASPTGGTAGTTALQSTLVARLLFQT